MQSNYRAPYCFGFCIGLSLDYMDCRRCGAQVYRDFAAISVSLVEAVLGGQTFNGAESPAAACLWYGHWSFLDHYLLTRLVGAATSVG